MGKCKDCKYWEHNKKDKEGEGFCKRYAPKLVFGLLSSFERMFDDESIFWPIWPETAQSEWCGEFEAKKIKPSPGAHA